MATCLRSVAPVARSWCRYCPCAVVETSTRQQFIFLKHIIKPYLKKKYHSGIVKQCMVQLSGEAQPKKPLGRAPCLQKRAVRILSELDDRTPAWRHSKPSVPFTRFKSIYIRNFNIYYILFYISIDAVHFYVEFVIKSF